MGTHCMHVLKNCRTFSGIIHQILTAGTRLGGCGQHIILTLYIVFDYKVLYLACRLDILKDYCTADLVHSHINLNKPFGLQGPNN